MTRTAIILFGIVLVSLCALYVDATLTKAIDNAFDQVPDGLRAGSDREFHHEGDL